MDLLSKKEEVIAKRREEFDKKDVAISRQVKILATARQAQNRGVVGAKRYTSGCGVLFSADLGTSLCETGNRIENEGGMPEDEFEPKDLVLYVCHVAVEMNGSPYQAVSRLLKKSSREERLKAVALVYGCDNPRTI